MLLVALFVAVLLAQPQQPEHTISGTVVDSVTGEPVPRAVVTLNGAQKQVGPNHANLDFFRSLATDESGRFSFIAPELQLFTLRATRRGYSSNADNLPPKTLSGSLRDAVIRLMPLGVITGRITDEAGEPVLGMNVTATQYGPVSGRKVPGQQYSATTDDLGVYRIYHLPVASYVLSTISASLTAKTVYGPAYSQDEVRVGAGETAQIDLRAPSAPAWSISGSIPLPKPKPDGAHYVEVRLYRGDREVRRGSINSATGAFSIRAVPPGKYTLQCFLWQEAIRYARVSVEVQDRNITGVAAEIMTATTVKGHVEGAPPAGRNLQVRTPRFSVSLISLENQTLARGIEAQPSSVWNEEDSFSIKNEEDSFSIKNVLPGRYAVEVSSRGTVASIESGGVDVLRHGLTVGAGPPPELTIRLTPDGGELPVKVAAGITRVLLLPDPFLHFALEKAVNGGEAHFDNIPPGNYTALALGHHTELEYHSPSAVEALRSKGVSVSVKAGKNEAIELKQVVEQP